MADRKALVIDPVRQGFAQQAAADRLLVGSLVQATSGALNVKVASDSTTAIQFTNAAGTAIAVLDTTNKRMYVGGSTAPTAVLHIAAGTAAAETAPLKLTSGTALTTPEDGALEYHSSHLYFTVGSTRYQLDQQSSTLTLQTDTASPYQTRLGVLAGSIATASYTTFLGYDAGGNTSAGAGSIYVGQSAGRTASGSESVYLNVASSSTGGSSVVVKGPTANQINTVAIGYMGLSLQGNSSVYIGTSMSIFSTITGSQNTLVGYYLGLYYTNTNDNVVLGCSSSYYHTTGGDNTFCGDSVSYGRSGAMGSCAGNVGAGFYALQLSSGYDNVGLGYYAGRGTTTSTFSRSVFVGGWAGQACTTGDRNVGIGSSALNYITTGSYNVAIGSNAGYATGITTLVGGVFIGYLSQGIGNYCVAIGYSANSAGSGLAIGYQAVSSTTTGNMQIGQGTNSRANRSLQIGAVTTNPYAVYGQSFQSYSDARLKSDVLVLSVAEGVDFVQRLQPIGYKLLDDSTDARDSFGFTSQQVKQVFDGLGLESNRAYDDTNEYWSLNYLQLLAPMVATAQTLSNRIQQLRDRIESEKVRRAHG